MSGRPLKSVANPTTELPLSQCPKGSSKKRKSDAAFPNDSPPAKRTRLTRTDAQKRPSRRSAGLKRQHPSLACLSEADAGILPSERFGLTSRNTRPETEDEETGQTTKTVQQLDLPKQPSIPPLEAGAQEEKRVSPATLSRKRQVNGCDNEHPVEGTQLTRKNLEILNNINNMRKKGASKASASAPPQSSIESSSTKTTSTTSSGFDVRAYKNGILLHFQSKPPINVQDFRDRYDQSRRTVSPTGSEVEDYIDRVENAGNESTMVFEVGGQLLKKYPREGYNRVFNQAFTGFPKDVGFNNGLSAPQPDYVEGFRMEAYDPFPVDERVQGAVLYKDDRRSVTLPHLAGEWKGPDGNMKEAELQSAYDGAALVFARNQALSCLGKSDPPGHAEVTTFTTDGTSLNLYAHYATVSDDGTLKYHQYRYKSANLLDDHKQGRRGLRNEQDHAYEQSCSLRDQLKENWKQRSRPLQSIAEGASMGGGTFSETNVDEAGYVLVEQHCQPTPAASSSVKSSGPALPVDNYVSCSSGQKRKASPSQESHESSKPKYWKFDKKSGRYYHKHSDGNVTWYHDSVDEN